MSSGIAYGISRLLVDDLQIQKQDNQRVILPSFDIVSSTRYNSMVESAITGGYKAIEDLNASIQTASGEEQDKLKTKLANKKAKIESIKVSRQLSDDVIDIRNFSFVKARSVDPMLKGLIDYVDEAINAKPEAVAKTPKANKAELKAAKAEASNKCKQAKSKLFKDIVNSVGIVPIENRKRVFINAINKVVSDSDFWYIKMFNRIFTHPVYSGSESGKEIQQYLTRPQIYMNDIIFNFNGKNKQTFIDKYIKANKVDANEPSAEHAKAIKSIGSFIDYFNEHKASKAQLEEYKTLVGKYEALIKTVSKAHEVKDCDVVDYYVNFIKSFNSSFPECNFGTILMQRVEKMVPIRFGNAIRTLAGLTAQAEESDKEEQSEEQPSEESKKMSPKDKALKAILSVDDIFYNKNMYNKIGKTVIFAENKAETIAYGLRIMAEIHRELQLIAARHNTDNFTVTVIYE